MGQHSGEAPWKVVSSEYLNRAPWLTVRRECLELPDGRRIPEYFVLEYPDWVNVIAMNTEGYFVLVRQYRHALRRTSIELPTGVVEQEDTSLLAAAQRELLEETGYGGGEWSEFMVLSANPATHNNLTHTFLARGVHLLGEQHLDATEELSVILLTAAELHDLLESGEIVQALMAAPLWKFFATTGAV